MSYGIIGKFFLDNKPVITSELDILKNVNEYRYSLTLENVESINLNIDDFDLSEECFEKEKGLFFNRKSFTDALDYYENKYTETLENVFSLKKMKESIEYYNLSDEGKSELNQNLDDYQEISEDLKWQVASINKIIGIFDLIENIYLKEKNVWNYSSNVVLYLEAC